MQVRLHASRGGVFGGHRPPRDPGGPLHYYDYYEKGRGKKKEKERSFTSIQMVHTHPAGAGSTLKGKRKKKADTHDGPTTKAAQGGRGTDGPPEPTYTAKRT